MQKKLPNLYVSKIEKKLTNNDITYYSAKPDARKEEKPIEPFNSDGRSIEEKIRGLFNSSRYVYKMNVTLMLKDGTTINKDIIGKVNNNLITIDEDLISIDGIRDIRY